MSTSLATAPWTEDERALALFTMRESLLRRLPAQMPAAAALDPHRREELVDEVITLTAYDSPHPVTERHELEALAWGTLRIKVLQAHEGRYDTVRGAYRRVDEAALTDLPGEHDDPVARAEGREQTRLVLEFIRRLEPLERDVFTVCHTAESRRSGRVGYVRIASELRLPEKVVRATLRTVEHKLAAYQKLVADPSTVADRALLALPAVAVADRAARPSGWRETLLDWLTRPFGHDPATLATTLAGTGGGRGLGTVAVALCLGGTAAGGGYCIATGDVPLIGRDPARQTQSAPARPAVDTADATVALQGFERQLTALDAAATRRAAERAADRRAARERQATRRARRRATAAAERREIAANTERSETAGAITPAASNAATDGSSEFDPTFQPSSPPQPAAPADPGGAPEFP